MDKLKLKIKTPNIQLELEGDKKHVFELRKLFSEINKLSADEMDQVNLDELIPSTSVQYWKFTKEMQKNDAAMELISEIAQVEEGLRVRKVSINNINEISDSGTTTSIDLEEIKRSMNKLFLNIDQKKTNFALIHTISDVNDEHCSIINDQIKKQIPHTKTKILKTNKSILGKTIIECLFFGNYPDEE